MTQELLEACKSLQDQIGPPAREWGNTDKGTLDLFVMLFWGNNPTYEEYKYVFGDNSDDYRSKEHFDRIAEYRKKRQLEEQDRI